MIFILSPADILIRNQTCNQRYTLTLISLLLQIGGRLYGQLIAITVKQYLNCLDMTYFAIIAAQKNLKQ